MSAFGKKWAVLQLIGKAIVALPTKPQRFLYLILALQVCLFVWMHPQPANAAPANPQSLPITQPNGFVFRVVLKGDETQNFAETEDGFTVMPDEKTGVWTYAVLDSNGHLVASSSVVGTAAPSPLARGLRPTHTAASPHTHTVVGASPQTANQTKYMAKGNQPVLVILVQFANQSAVGTTPTDWKNLFFATTNSVQNYYSESSLNQLNLLPATESNGAPNDGVVGWLALPYNHPNTNLIGTDTRKVAKDAVTAADGFVNYASYDKNGDSYISSDELHLVIVWAGYEGSYSPTPCGNRVWAHRANLAEVVKVDNVTVMNSASTGGYSAVGEWHCDPAQPPGHKASMGTIVHELGHDLGLPDLYDTDSSSFGVGSWATMGIGSWNYTAGNVYGSSPAYHDAFSKSYMGWITPTQLLGNQNSLALSPSATSGQAYQLGDNPGGVDWTFRVASATGEYFLVENRQRIGYDSGLPGCGLLVWHVDETRTYTNSANANDTRRLVDVEEADGNNDLDKLINTGDAGDVFANALRSFGEFSKPSSRYYNNAASGISIANVAPDNVACAPTTFVRVLAANQQPNDLGISADFAAPNPNAPPTLTPSPTLPATQTPTPSPTLPATQMPTASPTEIILPSPTATMNVVALNERVFIPNLLR